jgi:hypothetical protein
MKYLGNSFGNEEFVEGSKPFDLFSHFGQGIHYDPRDPRKPNYCMHVMDGFRGYYRWHRFNWIAFLLQLNFDNNPNPIPFTIIRWLKLDTLVGMAAEIHSKAKPKQSDENGNPPNPKNRDALTIHEIETIASKWNDLDFDQIETRLATLTPYPP